MSSDEGYDPDLEGVFEVSKEESKYSNGYPEETKYVRIEYDADGYYHVNCLDEYKNEITDYKFDGDRAKHRIEGALNSEPVGKYTIFV